MNQPVSVTHPFRCLLQDAETGADLITLSDPKPAMVLLYTTNSSGARTDLGSAEFVNNEATVNFTPTQSGAITLYTEVTIDGTKYPSTNDTERRALLSAVKQNAKP
ncbi:MAG: hypothetical protein HC933_06710 [Pleurocapsa sp. SU_196_0]|nr:hypothetical protein [Pleurocapsa sp. SU_196_0]